MKYIGEKIPGKDYIERRVAYALIYNSEGKVAIVRQTGELYGEIYNMIGGKLEDGEEPIEALARESKEEIGYDLKSIKFIEKVGCYCYVDFLDKYELAIIDFYSASIGERTTEQTEKGVELVWMKLEEAINKMYFDYHRYFLNKAKQARDLKGTSYEI